MQETSAEEPSTSSGSSSSPSPSSSLEPPNEPTFQRARLLEETTKLQTLKEKWSDKEREDEPKNIRDEILSVTGLTALLITSKFERFKSLIDENSMLLNDASKPQKVVPDDLDSFWEMMYIQVV